MKKPQTDNKKQYTKHCDTFIHPSSVILVRVTLDLESIPGALGSEAGIHRGLDNMHTH